MAGNWSRSRPRRLNIREQSARIQLFHPGFTCRVRGNRLVCHGQIQPTALTACYRVRLEYEEGGDDPKVWVEEPKLRRRNSDEPIPHTYEDDRPCLHRPRKREWTPDKLIATTILPWLSMWLLYYEIWLATGAWHGGGEHPDLGGGPDEDGGGDASADDEARPV
jgi:hypothetical protein